MLSRYIVYIEILRNNNNNLVLQIFRKLRSIVSFIYIYTCIKKIVQNILQHISKSSRKRVSFFATSALYFTFHIILTLESSASTSWPYFAFKPIKRLL